MQLILALASFPLLALLALATGSVVMAQNRFEAWSEAVAIRTAAGLVVITTALLILGIIGMLRPASIALLVAIVSAAAIASRRRIEIPHRTREERLLLLVLAITFVPLLLLAAYPPTEFDETLYHLPAVKRFVLTGGLPFIPELRMPVFPHFQEVLEVPLFHFGGGSATHAVSLLAAGLTATFLFDFAWRAGNATSGFLGVAFFLGSPLVVHLATSGYVDMLLTCFVVAALVSAERCRRSDDLHWPLLAGVFSGAAAAVKYLGLFWLAATTVIVFIASVPARRRRNVMVMISAALVVLLPWYARIFHYTRNPLFPFLPSLLGETDWSIEAPPRQSLLSHLQSIFSAPWDALFDRKAIGWQPPIAPWFLLAIPFAAWRRDHVARIALVLTFVWLAVWTFLPRDIRYLLPAIAIACGVSAPAVTAALDAPLRHPRRKLAIATLIGIILVSGPAYALWRVHRQGAVPRNAREADDYLRRRIGPFRGIAKLSAVAGAGESAFLCGGEELSFHFGMRVVGDFTGPGRYDRFIDAESFEELARRLARADLQYIVIVKGRCELAAGASPRQSAAFMPLYEDPFVEIARCLPCTVTQNIDRGSRSHSSKAPKVPR